MKEHISKLRMLQKHNTPFEVSEGMLRDALSAQFLLRADETKFVNRPTRITKVPPFVEEYFDFDFELGVFCMSRNIAFSRPGVFYLFENGKNAVFQRKIKCQSCNKKAGSSKLDTCPYKSEINNDDTTLCNCCTNCRHECAMDI